MLRMRRPRRWARLGALLFVTGFVVAMGAGQGWANVARDGGQAPPDPGAEIRAQLENAQQQAEQQAAALQKQLAQAQAEVQRKAQELAAVAQAVAASKIEEAKTAIRAQLATAPEPVRALGNRLLLDSSGPLGCQVNRVEVGAHLHQYLRVKGSLAAVTVTLEQPLCAPLTLSLASYVKDHGGPFPMDTQTLHDSDTMTIQDPGTYSWTVTMPTVGGAVCANQTDFFRSGDVPTHLPALDLSSLSIDAILGQINNPRSGGNTVGNLVDAVQYDQPGSPACSVSVGGVSVSAPSAGGVTVAGISASATPAAVKVAAAGVTGQLPTTGNDILPMAILGIVLIVVGWHVLALSKIIGGAVDTRRI